MKKIKIFFANFIRELKASIKIAMKKIFWRAANYDISYFHSSKLIRALKQKFII